MAAGGWYADPSGRHAERFYDGSEWTDAVRDGTVEGRDPVAGPEPVTGAAASPPPWSPAGGPGVLAAPPAPWTSAPQQVRSAKGGLPWFLVVALLFASFPAVLALSIGGLAVLAGNDISDAGRSYDGYSSTYELDYSAETDSVVELGDTTSDAGLFLVVLGGAALAFIVLAGTGSNVGRVVTVIWLGLASLWLLASSDDLPAGSGGYLLLFLAPPVLAIIGFLSPTANTVYRRT